MQAEVEIQLSIIEKILPAGYRVIKEESTISAQWNLIQLARYMHRSQDWVKENFLYPFRRFLDINQGGFIKYSTGSGSPWEMPIDETKQYIKEHYKDIFG
ncbi:hypothetical protein RD055328_08730 [Companilactobacillus sp. RD055328]|uniref:DUF771 domain-containing protein n=1 Tax=Companilactobacillus sp. RD055328 TaxID=2916634 RepID=UPI001FC8D2C7|nr:DUF771 domain-containing protein [Companilactobacillus sp. RD055328]GKQ42950.1 hypothetical protein RD055328_08730 [Companilactobacillus sp. RD055328]